ncbi:MAG: hypothetical protein K9L22_06485 [Methylococcaceae bacterium]|nr:hypothetical protein [Methylococcaceae bacterium]
MRYLCTGWNRTGTSTIGKILRDKSQRYTTYNEAMFNLLIEGKIKELIKIASEVDSADDFPFNLLFKEITNYNPDVQVIHTYVSDVNVWITRQKTLALRAPTKRLRIANSYLYGKASPFGNENIFIERYMEHNKEVCAFFEDSSNFIKVDLTFEGEQSKLLSWMSKNNLLGIDPKRPLPMINVSKKPFASYSVDELKRIKDNITLL